MKRFIAITCMVTCMLLTGAGDTNAIEDVGVGIGGMLFTGSGQDAEFGYYVKGRFPWGINSKDITKGVNQYVKADTNITFEIVTEPMVVYSNYNLGGYGETEADVLINKVRKSMGFWGSYLELGSTIWHERATSTAGEQKNTTKDGYFVGYTAEPIDKLKIELGAFSIKTDEKASYAFNFGFSFLF